MLQDFDLELRLLCDLIAVPDEQSNARITQALAGAKPDWDCFGSLVMRHRVGALVDLPDAHGGRRAVLEAAL